MGTNFSAPAIIQRVWYRRNNVLPRCEFVRQQKSRVFMEGADGTRSITSRFSTMPRYNFYFYIYRPAVHNEGFADVEQKWTSGGTPFHFADNEMSAEDYFIINPVDSYYKNNIKPQTNKIIADQAGDFTTPNVIWMEGHDSSGPNAKTVRIIKDIKKLLPNVNVVHSTLEDYSNALKESVNIDELTLVNGERRSAQYDLRSGNLYGYVTSSRMYLKLKNFEAEKWLQFYAESFNSVSGLLGTDINDEYLNVAWNYLIQNSAHDSIGGCSLDEIHEDMMSRYKQAIEISKGVFARACKNIALNINTKTLDKYKTYSEPGIFIVAINPNFYERNEIVKAFIDVPAELDKKGFEIIDHKGNKLNFQIANKNDVEPVLEQLIDRPMFYKMKRYECYIELNDIPQFGYETLLINPAKSVKQASGKKLAKVSNELPVIENDFIKIHVNKNGSLNVADKINKTRYSDIAYFYDEGEEGHAWVHTPVKPFYNTLKEKPEITIIENGILNARISIKHKLKVHANSLERKEKRGEKVKLSIELIVSLSKNSKRIDFEIITNNKAEDHRLRVMFPTDIEASSSYAEGQFDVVERSLDRPDTANWVEQPMYDYPLHNFVDLTDGTKGAAVLVSGLKEYEVLNDGRNTIALTLFRAFNYVIQPSSKEDYSFQKGSQCLGKQSCKIAFYPHDGNWEKGEVYKEALNFNNEIRLFQIGESKGKLSAASSFFKIEPEELVFSCFKKSADNCSFILRIYNPTNNEISGKITTAFAIKTIKSVTLEEIDVKTIKPKDKNSFIVTVGKKKIATYKITF